MATRHGAISCGTRRPNGEAQGVVGCYSGTAPCGKCVRRNRNSRLYSAGQIGSGENSIMNVSGRTGESFRLDGKRVLVTGGASGIGEATCRALSAAGASAIIGDVDRT